MLYVAICTDKPGHLQVRLDNRPAHVEWLKANAATIKTAGPFLSEDGQTMVGSLLIFEAPDRATVEALAATDPYAKAGLFGSVEFRPWRWAVGAPA